MKSFQSLFPPLSPNTLSLTSARRVVLVSYNADRGTIDFRHYIIKVKPYGVSKRVRRVLEGTTKGTTSMLDLGNEKDVADFLLRKTGEPGPDGGYESAASSTESVAGDDGDAVDLAEDYVGRNNKKGQRRAVRLDEVGPRMELRLIKITEGVPGKEGAVMYHEFGMILFPLLIMDYCLITRLTVKKSKKEVFAQKAEHAARTKLKKERREEQERNVQRKLTKEKKEEEEESGEEEHGEGWDGIGKWDDDEEISDGEDSDDPVESDSDEESSEEQPPTKRVKHREKR